MKKLLRESEITNTLGLDVKAEFLYTPSSVSELLQFLKENPHYSSMPLLPIGSASNILFRQDVRGVVIRSAICDIRIEKGEGNTVYVTSGSGMIWDRFVEYCVDRGWGGIENLSLIPGTVGASPVQNIGAYGVEAGDLIESVEYVDLTDGTLRKMNADGCRFGYRDSIFKREYKGRIFITHVTFRLSNRSAANIEYADLRNYFSGFPGEITISDIRDAVIEIRRAKLPDPEITGNAGSFFKNPVIPLETARKLQLSEPSLKIYPLAESDTHCKVPAAWFIEKCGFKGIRRGHAGVHDKQALVLLAFPGATSRELLELSADIIRTVRNRYDITLEPEVNII